MKTSNALIAIIFSLCALGLTQSCKNKNKTETKQENVPSAKPVVVNTDNDLRTSIKVVLKEFDEVTAEVNDGVVVLRGTIKDKDLQALIMKVQELKPKKIENQLVIKK